MENINELLTGAKKPLYKYAIMFTSGDKMEADDLLQDTLIRMFEKINLLHSNINFIGWGVKIMRNIWYNKLSTYRQTEDIDDNLDVKIVSLDSEVDFNFLKNLINSKLSGTLQVTFWKYYDGYSYEEISKDLNIPIGTVKSRINQSKQNLKSLINEFKLT